MPSLPQVTDCIQRIQEFLLEYSDESFHSVFFTVTFPAMAQGEFTVAGFAAGDLLQMETAITDTVSKIGQELGL
jgi:hypothetical protein